MKRKIALLLALAMTASMLPVNAFASSTNSVNKTVSVKEDDPVEGVFLKILPKEEVESNSSIILSLTNSEVLSQDIIDTAFQFSGNSDYSNTSEGEYYTAIADQNNAFTYSTAVALISGGASVSRALSSIWSGTNADDAYLPWYLTRTSKTEMEVSLFPITSSLCDTNYSTLGKPYYYIPLPVLADDEGDMTVVIDANETSISGGSTITFATCSSSDGSTVTTVDEVKDFNEELVFNDTNDNTLKIKETVSGSFEVDSSKGDDLTIRINSGFQFVNSTIKVEPGTNSPSFSVGTITIEDKKITIHFDSFTKTSKASSILISGITIEPEDEDDDWGEVTFSVKGIGITSETITVANRADYGMSMTLNEDATTILTGFSYEENTTGNSDYPVGNSDLDEDDFVTAEVHIEETIKDTWNVKQKMYFLFPEMVKVVDIEVEDCKKISSSVFDSAYLSDDGSTLIIPRLDQSLVNDQDCSEFDIKFYLTIDPAFGDNDITLSVYGAGIEEGLIADKVVATAVTPITISTEATATNIGYSSISTADVTITENVAGALIDDEDLEMSIDTLWTQGDIGFDDSYLDATATGELDIKAVKTKNGVITIPIDGQSYTTPGSIEVTGIYVGTTRSVPYGDYDLKVAGAAVINNYDEDYDANYKTTTTPLSIDRTSSAYKFVISQDNTSSYAYAGYLSVATQTGTLDVVVSVTIGENTIYVDGEAYTMDVAPYIQASSNSTMVPLRFVTLALGVDTDAVASGDTDNTSTITWDSNTKTATIFYAAGSGQKIIQFTADSNIMVVDGTSVPMDYGVVAEITDSRMFVPFRALGTALGVTVSWDETTRTATYNG